jgi:hypothetical protein
MNDKSLENLDGISLPAAGFPDCPPGTQSLPSPPFPDVSPATTRRGRRVLLASLPEARQTLGDSGTELYHWLSIQIPENRIQSLLRPQIKTPKYNIYIMDPTEYYFGQDLIWSEGIPKSLPKGDLTRPDHLSDC